MTEYLIEGYSGDAYVIREYCDGMAVFEWRGYLRGDRFRMYPHKAIFPKEHRDKFSLHANRAKKKMD